MDIDSSFTLSETSLITPMISETPTLHYSATMSTPNDSWVTDAPLHDTNLSIQSPTACVKAIENGLKKLPTQQIRKPTPSPFFLSNQSSVSGISMRSNLSQPMRDDGNTGSVPSTAEVLDLLSSDNKDPADRDENFSTNEFTLSENYSSSVAPNVSPKKRLIMRSISHTEPTSPGSGLTSVSIQSQKTLIDDERFVGHSQSNMMLYNMQHIHNDVLPKQEVELSAQSNADFNQSNNYPTQADLNLVHSTINRQKVVMTNKKRSIQEAINGGGSSIKREVASPMLGVPGINEVSSSGQAHGSKRGKTVMVRTDGNIHQVHQPPLTAINPGLTISNNHHSNSDDQRKQHIRESNRDAARRCRERRRNYIESLEAELEKHKTEIQRLNEKLTHAERDNAQLRTFLKEAGVLQTRQVSDEHSLDYTVVFNSNNAVHGIGVQRAFVTRSAH